MEKIFGTTVRQDGLQRIGRNTWLLFFSLYETEDGGTYEYRHTFNRRPTLDEIKEIINAQLSADADERKRNGFKWQGVPVRYDEEAERNITGLSVKIPRLGAAMFPLKFKLGDYPDGTPAFYEFADAEEFESFTDALMLFSQECYNKLWTEKSAIDWTKFEAGL
jgi:hypothetical protein